ncbi:uncharacterized protein LOC130743725 [Lotus japonicus]|uniref:uncharacterized protein LOC130743725 n=1 Tax=Lotus japonicus TaxID=34305 RepID=UPI0025905BC7|nr:uncharacterized protein LOC130743725 [Lotus japonicus]
MALNDDPSVFAGDEDEVLHIGEVEIDPTLVADVWLIGRVLAPHTVSRVGFIRCMEKLWESRSCEEVRHVGGNLFAFRFISTSARDLVLRSSPWFFAGFMIALNVFNTSVDPNTIPLNRVPLWVQALGLPYTYRSEKLARILGGAFDGFLGWDKFFGLGLRFRVWVNVETPLRKGKKIAAVGRESFAVRFKYEKLVNFCYRCGRLDNIEKHCEMEALLVPEFGPWMRAEGDFGGGGRRNQNWNREEEKDFETEEENAQEEEDDEVRELEEKNETEE